MGRKWREMLGWVAGVAVLGVALPAAAQEVRIISVDGQLVPGDQAGPVEVWPGQVVSLAADEVWIDRGERQYAYRPVEDFRWVADDVADDVCDPEADCRQASNFEATDYGVNYYVPRDAPARIRIAVQSKYRDGSDVIDLVNRARQEGLSSGYDYGLGDDGWWTVVDGDRVFVPYAYDDDWAPYEHGYWYWTSYGWTWYSYDPWGHVTDHYGHWRHHGVYGWVWLPDPGWIWRAAVVSFFFGDGWIGWWPYDDGWSHGYRRGYASGYDDGYWMGYWAGRRVGDYRGRHVRPGATCVADRDFYVPGGDAHPPDRAERGRRLEARTHDIASVRITDAARVERDFTAAVRDGSVGKMPGGSTPAEARRFFAQRTGVTPSETALKSVKASMAGTVRHGFEPVRAPFAEPASYQAVARRVHQAVAARPGARGVPASIGAAVAREGGERATGRALRAPAPAPVLRTPGARPTVTWTPRARGEAPDRPAVAPRTPAANPATSPAVRTGPERPAPEPAASPRTPAPERTAAPTWERRAPEPTPAVRTAPQPTYRPSAPAPAVRTAPQPTYRPPAPEPAVRTAPQPTYRPPAPEPAVRTAPQRTYRPSAPAPAVRTAPQPTYRPSTPTYRPSAPSRPSYGGSSSGSSSSGSSSSSAPYVAPPPSKAGPARAPGRSGGGGRRSH